MRASLQLRLGQQLAMTPQLRQAIRLLQLSAQELQDEIRQALESNVMLVPDETGTAPNSEQDSDSPASESASDSATDSEWELQQDGLANDWPDAPERADPWQEPAWDPMENMAAANGGLQEHMRWQIRLSGFSPLEMGIAEAIVDGLDDDGYLTEPLDDIAAATGAKPDVAEQVLHRIQAMDPPGVGARDLSECLLAQLRLAPPSDIRDTAMKLVAVHLEALARPQHAALAKTLARSEADVDAAIALVRTLNPRPGSAVEGEGPEYVIPDVILVRRDNRWAVELNGAVTPRLSVNQQYLRMMRAAPERSPGMQALLQEARWLIRSLGVRNDTLSRVSQAIVDYQQAYFDHGDEAMRPLILREIADQVELHESTVSRVTANKYLHTPRGTLPLKFFFSQQLASGDGDSTSAVAVRAMIRKLIEKENPAKPMSDKRIADTLSNQGIQVARRTVTKYREAMRIPASYDRKNPLKGRSTSTLTR